MADLVIKPAPSTGNKLILQTQNGTAALTTSDAGVDSATSIVATKTGTETLTNKTLTTPTVADMSNCTFPAGHIIQRVNATLTNLTTGEVTGGNVNAVADAIGQITITSGNGVLIYWTTRITITAGTNSLGAVRIAEGTVASVGTVLKSQYFGTTGDPGYGTYHAPSIWFYDSSPADTTPDYVLLTERQSSSTQGMQSYGAPDNMCILFEVRQ